MKKILFLSLAAFALSLASCKKCKTCTTTTTVSEQGSSDISTQTSADYCHDDYDDAPGNVDVTTQDGNTTTHVVINCVEK